MLATILLREASWEEYNILLTTVLSVFCVYVFVCGIPSIINYIEWLLNGLVHSIIV